MIVATKTVLRCERCGEGLASGSSPAGDCLNCQLLDSLAQSGHESETPTSLPAEGTGTQCGYQHYEILVREDGSRWELGRGAMGVTYKALDVNLHVPVALKVINPRYARSARARARFLSEARTAARLRHPNVASVFHFGMIHRDADDRGQEEECFYAMEFVEGETLEAHLRRTGPLDAGQAVEIARQITRALVAAEKHGIIHRDLKPANLMLVVESKDAQASHGEAWVKVIDFGLAKAVDLTAMDNGQERGASVPSAQGGFSGTPHFASPEQFDGRAVDGRADVFSLGVVLWYTLTGELPFEGASLRDIHERQVHRALPLDQLRRVQVPAPLVELLGRLLSPEPSARPASAAALYAQLERCREALQPSTLVPARRDKFGGWKRWTVTASVLVLLVAGGFSLVLHRAQRTSSPISQPSGVEKSVAVLPFENFSADKDSAIFADGVQDEVLTDLTKVADLKVVSRASVASYKDAAARSNLREIGQALGVVYVVEGSVRRSGNQIRITAQLIDTRTGTTHWANYYDRPLNDVFAIQSEIARAIAGQLQASLSPREQAAMTEVPTRDLEAYSLFLRAQEALNNFDDGDVRARLDQALALLNAATARDPRFTRAYACAALVQGWIYCWYEPTEARAATVRGLIETVQRLRPGSADACNAAGMYSLYVSRDIAQAREQFAAAARLAPNDAETWESIALAERLLGHWTDALVHIQQAATLAPNSTEMISREIELLSVLRRYPEAMAIADRWTGNGRFVWMPVLKASLFLDCKADLAAARTALASVPPGYDAGGWTTIARVDCDRAARDFAAAGRDLAASTRVDLPIFRNPGTGPYRVPPAYYEGLLARDRGEQEAAVRALASARVTLEKAGSVSLRPGVLMALATIDAALGRPTEAVAEGRQAITLCPPEKNAFAGLPLRFLFARVLAWAGERDEAIRTLQALADQPGGLNYGSLKLSPDWDLLRGDTRFEALVASLAPK